MSLPETLQVRGATVDLRVVDPDDAYAVEATRCYVAELDLRFPDGFDPGPLPPEPDATWVVALSDGEPVAYGGIRPAPSVGDDAAEIKRMWVHDGWRGVGLGQQMLRHLESLAAAQGFATVVLDTNGSLVEAIAMYDRAGYRRIERYNDNPYAEVFFAKDVSSES